MKKLIIEEENEGLLALLGETVTIFTSGYFYNGKLIGVNNTCIKLEKPSIIYETGKFSDSNFKDIQSLNTDYWYVSIQSIESFGLMKNER
jgi:hypothetical protein